jgi:hypothetical protein
VGESGEKADHEWVLCALCGEPIGVYEPAVFVAGPVVTRTSRAARPGIEEITDYRSFHHACYEAGDEAAG